MSGGFCFHRVADLQHQLEPLADRMCVFVAVPVDSHALDVLHHQVRTIPVGRAAVVEAGDIRMIECCGDLPLGQEALVAFEGFEPFADDLDSRTALVLLVSSVGEIDVPHAASA